MRFRAAQKGDTYKNQLARHVPLDGHDAAQPHAEARPDLYKNIYDDYQGKASWVGALQGGDAIGGNKGRQLRVQEKFVNKLGCTYNELGVSPMSYRLYKDDECSALERLEEKGITWLLKPETGSQGQGITFHSEVASVMAKVPKFFPCNKSEWKATERYLVQEYLERPLLLNKSKFDVRVNMLIASSSPCLVFYYEGYLRRALAEYSPMSKDRRVYLTNTHLQSIKKGFKLSDHIQPYGGQQPGVDQPGCPWPPAGPRGTRSPQRRPHECKARGGAQQTHQVRRHLRGNRVYLVTFRARDDERARCLFRVGVLPLQKANARRRSAGGRARGQAQEGRLVCASPGHDRPSDYTSSCPRRLRLATPAQRELVRRG
jgi:hypothetical protein